jgi:hypothetical protein
MMKKIVLLFIAFLTIGLNSCATYTTATANKWLEYELPPSKIVLNGDVIFGGKLSNGSKFIVFFDNNIDDDARYYHTMLWQDFGWTLKDDKTWSAPQNARERKLGHIYISPSRGAAVYYYPDRNYSAFKVNITK